MAKCNEFGCENDTYAINRYCDKHEMRAYGAVSGGEFVLLLVVLLGAGGFVWLWWN